MIYEDDDARAEVVKRMELIIAKHTHSKNLNFKEYRYPVKYKKNGQLFQKKGNGTANVTMQEIPSMKYEFGAHTVNIGKALMEILAFLEENIWLDNLSASGNSFDYFNDGQDTH